ncbi:hypothetical protein [Kitasatospora sp. NPDC058190]|uniref:hypothetical protein n=1 Tax=Kitasatospora sp. NPDC058190 TaxID=3346371 RepID=UPI0036D94198
MGGVTAYLVIAAWSGVPWRRTAAQPVPRILATLIGGLLQFWWLPHLLLGRRVPWRGLLPGAAFTVATLVGLRFFSWLVFAPPLVSNAISYAAVGTVLVVQSWLTWWPRGVGKRFGLAATARPVVVADRAARCFVSGWAGRSSATAISVPVATAPRTTVTL